MSSAESVISAIASAKVMNSKVVLPAGRYDAVVDLQHVQRRGEVEDVDEQAEHRGGDEMPAALSERIRQHARKFDAEELQRVSPDARLQGGIRSRTIGT